MKKKVELKDLGKTNKKEHLKMVHKFLNREFRPLEKKEIKDTKVFIELFGENEPIELYKLRAIYEFQN